MDKDFIKAIIIGLIISGIICTYVFVGGLFGDIGAWIGGILGFCTGLYVFKYLADNWC
jgi:hypothetical protein